jgi:ABC-type phosphate transport system permease subunit
MTDFASSALKPGVVQASPVALLGSVPSVIYGTFPAHNDQ